MDYTKSPYLVRLFDFDVLHMELNTPLYMLVLVLVVMFLLNRWLFRPVLRTLDNRAGLVKSLHSTIDSHREEITRLTQHYETQLAQVRTEVARVRAESNRATQAEVDTILQQARTEAQSDFQAAMDDLHQQVDAAKRELGSAAERLAEQTTNRILQA